MLVRFGCGLEEGAERETAAIEQNAGRDIGSFGRRLGRDMVGEVRVSTNTGIPTTSALCSSTRRPRMPSHSSGPAPAIANQIVQSSASAGG